MRKELRFGRVLVALSTEGGEFTVTITSASSGAVLSRAVIEDEAQLADVTGKLLALKAQNKAAPPAVEAPTPPVEAPAPPPAAEQAAAAPRARAPRAPRSAPSAPEVVRSASQEALAQTASLCERAETMLARVEKLNRGKPDLWTEAQRADANLCAMWTLHCVEARGDVPTADEQTKIKRYSGWGGLSHQENWEKMPPDVKPEIEGLLDEYYTPSNVAADVVRVIREKWEASLPQHDGTLQALEPSAGIGRFIRAAQDAGLPARWTAIEFSNVSARMLQASMPTVEVNHSSFEKWAQGGFGGLWGKIGLILSNPPYPTSRGDRAAQDFATEYNEPAAFIYFIRRALDALAPKGIGVMVVPSGFLSGSSYSETRAKVLQRHHLLAAFRTPNGLFPGADLNIDVLFFEARGGTLKVPNKSDADVIAGRYFETHRGHILGTEKGTYGEGAKWDYKVLGTFNGFPAFDPRPIQTESELQPFKAKINYRPTVKQAAISGDPYGLDRATTMGARVRSYFSLLADGTTPRHVEMWPELHADLLQWKKEHGNPRESTMLRDHAPENNNVAMFLSAWDRAGELVAQVATQPQWMSPIQGNAGDMAAVANALWRGQTITLEDVGRAVANARNVTLEDAMLSVYEGLPGLYAAGWRLDGERFNVLIPSSQFLEGEMWPRYDNAGNALVSSDILRGGKIYGSLPKGEVEQQRKEIIAALKLPSWEDINQPFPDTEDPRRRYTPVDRWVPFDIIKKWIHEKLSMSADRAGKRGRGIVRGFSDFKPDTLSLNFGAIAVKGVDFSAEELSVYDVDKVVGSSNDHAVRKFIGWYNHMNRLFVVRAEKESPQDKTTAADVEKARKEVIRDWIRGFYAWIETPANEENRERILNAYHRVQFGYLDPKITAEPLNIKRWTGYVKMHPWQNAGARRVLRNRTGLVAFDVGVGKCVRPETLVRTSRGLVPIRDIAPVAVETLAAGQAVPVQDWSVFLHGQWWPVEAFYSAGTKPVVDLQTQRGYALGGSQIHPVWARTNAGEGWVKTPALRIGDYLCLDRSETPFPTEDMTLALPSLDDLTRPERAVVFAPRGVMTPEMARLLGYIVAEGFVAGEYSFSITQSEHVNPEVHADIARLLDSELGWSHKPSEDCEARPSSFAVTSVFLRRYLDQFGIDYEKSSGKRVPDAVLRGTRSTVVEFLRGLFEGDGSISGHALEYSSASEQLIREVQTVLLGLGVVCSRAPKRVTGYEHTYWRLTLTGADLRIFRDKVGFVSTRKQTALALACDRPENANLDIVPFAGAEVGALYDAIQTRASRPGSPAYDVEQGGLYRRFGPHFVHMIANVQKGTQNATYAFLAKMIAAAEEVEVPETNAGLLAVRALVERHYYYDPIESVSEGAALLVDLQVADCHAFVGNGFVNHNTFTGIGIIAKAREEGWVRHPVLLVPNSIVWKWYRDVVEKCLGRVVNGVNVPEYKVCVIGSKMVPRNVSVKEAKTVGEGRNKHTEIVTVIREQMVAEPDTPQDRGEKWGQFQRGEYDLAIVTYSVLGATEMDPEMVVEFVKDLHSVRQSIALGKERELPDEDEDDVPTDTDEGDDEGDDETKKESERKRAKRIVDVKQFVADKLKQRTVDGVPVPYDIGPRWDDIGVDMIVVDEAQNFKNLFATERKWKYMSSLPKGSKRAWNLFFRCASVRKKQGGGGVVLLSATPAKNSPLEFYSILSYLDPKIWENIGIHNQEQFVDRFIEDVEITAIGGDGKPKKAIGAVAFKNLDEIRRVLNRWGEFKTPLDIAREYPGAGIRLPEPTTRYIDDVGNSYSTRFRPNVNFCYDGEMANLWFNHKGEPVHIVDVGLAPSEHQRIKDRLYRALYVEFQKAGATDPKMRGKALALVTRRAMIAVHPCLDECAEAHTEVKNGKLIVVNTKTGKRLTTPDGNVVSAVQFLSEPRAYGSKWSIKSAKEVGSFQSPKFDACAKRIAASLSCGQVVLCPKGREDETMEILQRFGTPANVMIAVKHEDHAQDVFRLVSGRMRKPGEIQVVVCSEEVMLKARAENLGCQRYTMPFGGENVDGQKEVARAVFGTRTCGHVIFLESIAGHVWLEKTLVHYGIDPARIAVLNGKTAPSPGKRLAIADAFNGDAEKMVDPLYDVVIANSVAYEGIDLQQRTCAIHHVDLPWEPATLHQRNGRGVRQGNKMGSIEIAYYFGRCSGDALRFNMIGGKRGWMVSLLQSQDLKTNNPAAGQGIEGVIGMVSCSREEAEEALSEACVSQVIDERKQTKSRVRLLLGRASYACARSRYASAQGFKGESIQVFRDDAKASVDEIYAKVSERSYPFLSRVAQANDYLFPPTSELPVVLKSEKKEKEEKGKRHSPYSEDKQETPQDVPFYVRADGSEYTHTDDRAADAGGKVKPAGGDDGADEDKYAAPEPAEKKAPTSIRVYPVAFILPPVWESCRMKLIQRNSYGSLAVSFSHYGSVVAHAKAVPGPVAGLWATKDVIGHRVPGSAEWKLRDFGEVAEELHAATRSYVKSKHTEYDFNNPPPFARRAYCLPLDIYDVSDWPDDDHETAMRAVEAKLKHSTALELKSKADPERYDSESRIWEELAWYAADETWLARYWGIYAPRILMDLSIPGSEYQSAGWIAGRWQVGGYKPRQGLYNIGNKNLPGIAADGSFSLVPRESITKENVHEKLALVPMPTYANLLRFREALSALNPKRSANTYGTFNSVAIAWWGESLGESVIGKKFSDVTDIVDAVMVWIRAGKPTDQKIRTLGVVEAIRQSLEWIDKERGLALSGIVFSEDPAVNGNSGNLWDALVAAIPAEKMDDVRSELIWDVRKRADLYAWNDPETRKKENELQEKPSEIVRGKTPSEDEGDEDGEEDEGYES